MRDKKFVINYIEYDSMAEMSPEDRELLNKAIDALKGSYAPYSLFNVGAAVRLSDGTVVLGSNQENIAYPSGLCAESTAIFSAHAQYPEQNIKAIAIISAQNGKLSREPVSPCGACRQVMAESQKRSGSPIEIILGSSEKILKFNSVEGVLPLIFDSEEVKGNKKK